MSCLYKDGNGNISVVAGTLQQSVINEIKEYVNDRTTLDYTKTIQIQVGDAYTTYSWTVPSRGKAIIRLGATQGHVVCYVNNKLIFSHDTMGHYMSSVTVQVEAGDTIRISGTFMEISHTPFKA